VYSSFFDCGEQADFSDEQIDWAWLIEDCDSEEECAALEAARDAALEAELARRAEDEWERTARLERIVECDDLPF